jgi:hypothetical protein
MAASLTVPQASRRVISRRDLTAKLGRPGPRPWFHRPVPSGDSASTRLYLSAGIGLVLAEGAYTPKGAGPHWRPPPALASGFEGGRAQVLLVF